MFIFTAAGLFGAILVSRFYACLHLFAKSNFLTEDEDLKGGDDLKGQSLGCRESWCSRGNSYRVSCCYTCNVIVAFLGNQLSTSGDFCCTLQSLTGFTSPAESVKVWRYAKCWCSNWSNTNMEY